MAQISLILVDVVGALSASSCVLAVLGVHCKAPGTDAENQGILKEYCEVMRGGRGTCAYLRPDGSVVFRVSLHREIQGGNFVFMLE